MLESIMLWFVGIANWAAQFGYFGGFMLGFLSAFTLFIPSPAFAFVAVMAAGGLNPILLGVAAALGATLGEMTSFVVGYGSRRLIVKKHKRELARIERLFQKYQGWLVIFVFSATPLPFDLVGIFCGNVGYPLKKFVVPTLAGKLVKYIAIAFAGAYGIQWISGLILP